MASSRWALLNLARTLKTKFEQDWNGLGIVQRRAWGRAVLAGIATVMAALFAMIFGLRHYSNGVNHFPWEEEVLRVIERAPVSFGTGVWLQTFGTDFMLIVVVLAAAGLAIWHDRPLLGLSILLALIVMDAVVRIGWLTLARERPDIIAGGVASPGYHSFPSGHTSKSVVVYGLLFAQWFRASRSVIEKTFVALLAFAITLAVPYGRMRMGVHWPIDVAAGYALGLIWLGFLLAALRRRGGTDAGAPRESTA